MRLLYLLIFLIPFQNHPLLSRAIVPALTPIKMVGLMVLGYSLYLKLKNHLHYEPVQKFVAQEVLFLLLFLSQILLGVVWYPEIGANAMKSIISFLIFYVAITTITP